MEALDAIDRTGTFAEAAVLLHRVPSALTYLVQKTESELASRCSIAAGGARS